MQTYLTPQNIQELLDYATVQFHQFPDTTLTVCAVTLPNGFTVAGESACVSLSNFDTATGEHLAYEDAVRKVWMFEGYLLRQMLSMAEDPETMSKIRQLEAMEDKPRIVVPS